MSRLLIVDDDPNTLASLSRAFRLAGHEATVCDNAVRALELVRGTAFRHALFRRRDAEGKDGLVAAGRHPYGWALAFPVVMISGQAHIEMAVRATRLGARIFWKSRFRPTSCCSRSTTFSGWRVWKKRTGNCANASASTTIVWASEAMRRVMAQVERVAASETRVCILGETGTGKELVARAVHERSPRAAGPFVTLNCAAVPAELIESELFGHEKGSFTGAAARHVGKFEQAHGGTLFLDEIGDMPLAMQAKLLRVLEEGESGARGWRPAGSGKCACRGGHACGIWKSS